MNPSLYSDVAQTCLAHVTAHADQTWLAHVTAHAAQTWLAHVTAHAALALGPLIPRAKVAKGAKPRKEKEGGHAAIMTCMVKVRTDCEGERLYQRM